jgi:hypothetical protein
MIKPGKQKTATMITAAIQNCSSKAMPSMDNTIKAKIAKSIRKPDDGVENFS